MASHAKAEIVEKIMAEEFRFCISGTATVPDAQHGWVVVLYQAANQAVTAFPVRKKGVKVLVKRLTPIKS